LNVVFLNAGFLFAALAALLPLVIHLISRRRTKTVDFSSLRFLKELERKKVRRVRLRQVLLLVIRSLILLAVALALARPTLRGAAGASVHARTSAVIVLDTSASMSRKHNGRTVFDEAVRVCREIVSLMDEGDQAFLVDAATPRAPLLDEGTFARGVLLDALDGAGSGAGGTDYVSALEQARELLAGARNLNREIYVVGDLQRSGWRSGSAGVEPARGAEPDGPSSADVFLVQVGASAGNLGVSAVDVARRYGGPSGHFSVTSSIVNHGTREVSAPAKIYVDGEQVGQSGIRVPAGGTATVSFAAAVDDARWHAGHVELPEDALAIDDRRSFVIPAASPTEVLVVGADGREALDDAYYLARALDPAAGGERYRPVVVDASALAAQDRSRYALVVLADPGELGGEARRWLEGRAREGGACLAILGSRTDVRSWNTDLAPTLGAAAVRAPFERESGVRLAPAVGGHPLLEGLVVGDRLIDDVSVRRGFVVDAANSEVLLELPGIGPALAIARAESGANVATLATGLDRAESDLPKSGLLVPLVDRLASRLTGDWGGRRDFVVGEAIELSLPATPSGRLEFETPHGERVLADRRAVPRETASLRGSRDPGVYRLFESDEPIALAAVNVDPAESRLDPIGPSDLEEIPGGSGFRFVSPDAEISGQIMEARRGREIWRALIYLALGLVAIEMIVARPRAAWVPTGGTDAGTGDR